MFMTRLNNWIPICCWLCYIRVHGKIVCWVFFSMCNHICHKLHGCQYWRPLHDLNRQHFLQCPPGVLNKHFEKLIQCDTRLNMLSQQPEIVMDTPYFDTQASAVENPDEFKSSQLWTGEGSPISSFPDVASPTISDLSSLNFDTWDSATTGSAKEAPSPSSGISSSCVCEFVKWISVTDWDGHI